MDAFADPLAIARERDLPVFVPEQPCPRRRVQITR